MRKLQLTIIFLVFLPLFVIQAQTIFPVPKYPYQTCIVDYDLDGDNDIIVGSTGPNQDPDSLVIFFNDGWGNFDSVKFEIPNQIELYCKDLTGDSYPDIITESVDNMLFYENDKSGSILYDENAIMNLDCHPNIGGITDINGDNKKDIIYYCRFIPYGWGVQFNNGDNTFTDSAFVESNETNLYAITGYINGDNQADILQTTLGQSESVYILYNSYPEFEKINIATPHWNRGYILNVNNNTLNDVLLANLSYFGSTKIVNMLNEVDHFQACDTLDFENGTYIGNVGDYNLDGYDDLSLIVYQANNNPIQDSIYIYFNDQNCGYTHSHGVFMGDYFWLATINSGDLNGDGYPELVIQGYSMPTPEHIRILWNDGTGHFIDTNSVYVGEKEYMFKNHLTIYPNHFSSTTTIQFYMNTTDVGSVKIDIYDQVGKVVQSKYVQAVTEGVNTVELNMHGSPTGIYYCSLTINGKHAETKKMVVVR